MVLPWLRRLVASLSPWRTGFAPGSIHVGLMVDKVELGHVFLRVLRFSPVNATFYCRSLHSYHLGDEQYVRQWQQFRDVVLPHNNQSIKREWINVIFKKKLHDLYCSPSTDRLSGRNYNRHDMQLG
jgi:hypothetical protein